jgi:hypothetical protein
MRTCSRFIFSAALTLSLLAGMSTISAQTLFANPRCDAWAGIEKPDKLQLLSAVIAPLNMAWATRIKPAVDKFVKLDSVEPALIFVNDFCAANPDKQAIEGMMTYHAELVK